MELWDWGRRWSLVVSRWSVKAGRFGEKTVMDGGRQSACCVVQRERGTDTRRRRRERSDTTPDGSRQARRDASPARSEGGAATAATTSDKAGRSISAMAGAGGTGSGAGREARRLADVPNALTVQVWRRLRPQAEHSGSGEASSARLAPKANLEVAEAHEDAEVARINREARLPLSAPSLEPQASQSKGTGDGEWDQEIMELWDYGIMGLWN